MPIWGTTDTGNNSPKTNSFVAGSSAIGNTGYANVLANANFEGTNNEAVGYWGIDVTEAALTAGKKITHAGWNIIRQGTGNVLSIAVSNNGSGYANTNLARVSNGVSNASANVVTDGAGGLVSFTMITGGGGFINVASSVGAITNSTGGATGIGTGGLITPTLGGRAGRITYECTVAMGMANTANSSGKVPGIN